MGLIILLLILILLMPIGFIWLNYHELTSCKANAYDELARINKEIEALIDLIPDILGLISGKLANANELIAEINMQRNFLIKLPNTFRNAKTRFNYAQILFELMKKLITKIATNPNLQFLPAIQKASKLFDKINNDFENSTKNYNETVSKFYNYTSVFPTSFMAKKLKIVCILPMFISEKK